MIFIILNGPDYFLSFFLRRITKYSGFVGLVNMILSFISSHTMMHNCKCFIDKQYKYMMSCSVAFLLKHHICPGNSTIQTQLKLLK